MFGSRKENRSDAIELGYIVARGKNVGSLVFSAFQWRHDRVEKFR